jgi:flagellar basal body-associated protein FliL
MIQNKRFIVSIFILLTIFLFILASCSNLPLIGSKKEKAEKVPPEKIVTVEGMETINILLKNLPPQQPLQRKKRHPM